MAPSSWGHLFVPGPLHGPGPQGSQTPSHASPRIDCAGRAGARTRVWLVVVLFLACLPGVAPGVVAGGEYTIGAYDVLSITVWGQSDLSKDYQVDAQGFVPFPLLGRVKAGGLTVTQLAAHLTTLLEKDYLVNPQVIVTVKEYLSKKIQVIGEAEKPGLFYLTGPTTVLEALARAGGLTKAAGKQLFVVRTPRNPDGTSTGGSAMLRVSLDKLRAGDTSEDISLEDGDTIVVPRTQAAFFVLGEVNRPGTFPLDKDTTVLDAITIAGGFNEKAQPGAMRIIRRIADGGQETLPVDLASAAGADRMVKLEDGDTVIVPRGNAIFVFGEVKKPGTYQLDRPMNVLEAIIVAGGFTDKAAPGRTRIIRNGPEGEQIFYVDVNDLLKNRQRGKVILLKENDVVVVPQSFF
jgi:polysaccharide biosynthesis/export protein